MTPATLAAYLLLALRTWAPESDHAYHEASAVTDARYQSIASDIAAVALDPSEPSLFAGDDGRVRTAVLLAAVATFESGGLRADIAWCRASGDHGHAWGLWQSHRSQARVCSSVREAARVALSQMAQSFAACEQEEPEVWLSAYTSGRCSAGHAAARNRWKRAADWVKAHPIGGGP